MTKLSLNKAAVHASVAKATILEALKSNDPLKKLSAEKNAKGHWEIDVSELERVFKPTSSDQSSEPMENRSKNHQKPSTDSALEVEVKMLREQITKTDLERERERDQLEKQIENLRETVERQSQDHRQALAVLTDQREKASDEPKRGFWARLTG